MKEERLQRLTHFVGEVRNEMEAIQDQMDNVDSSLNEIEDIIEAEKAHSDTSGSQDARDQLSTGDAHDVVIEEPPGKEGPDAVARIEGIVTFVSPQDFDIKAGDTVRIKLTDIGENHARGVATEIVD